MQLPLSVLGLIEHFFSFCLPTAPLPQPPPKLNPPRLELELRHLHAASHEHIVFSDITPSLASERYSVGTRALRTARPPSFAAIQAARRGDALGFGWEEEDIHGPNVDERETLLTLAKMTSNAYARPGDSGWYDLGGNWNTVCRRPPSHNHLAFPVGWQPGDDGFRGHVFATPDNGTVVLSIKGTSVPFLGGGPTTRKDKLNDNLLFSCCCARVDWSWSTVCGCYRGAPGQRCDQACVERALVDESLFYTVGTNLYNNLTYMFPEANIWLIGHSLGGGLAALLGSTFGAPVVAFEAPGERMAHRRLHLPSPPSLNHITHVYNTADPIPLGTCTGSSSTCGMAGYALESRCHLGNTILYDTVANLSWPVDARSHRIGVLTDTLLAAPWPPAEAQGREVPAPAPEDGCVDCAAWEFGDFPAMKGAGNASAGAECGR
ncbi:Alpha/Beta hydrolase protein [Vararia minispora EC-137]|uniref:Alpha/Beta hydrolase protein n=1 Tax=Vararia minispora EC-137 TaxID=1314806 RepID=A0ACB8QDG3_9AGAM|nr:Alpha/Beta hydrolase protein [Vararia minispora EC-137]